MALHKEFNELLKQCSSGETGAALSAKLQLIVQDRETRTTAACQRVQAAAAAIGVLGSSGAGGKLWDHGKSEAERAADRAMEACFSVGLDGEPVGGHIGAEAKDFMIAFTDQWLQPYGEIAVQCKREALTMATRVARLALVRGFDRKQQQEKERPVMITLNITGGNVQVGDRNNQTVTYQTFLAGLADAIEKSPEAPPDKKAAWATTLRELAAHPLTQTLIGAAAGVAGGGK
jgi:hypothetical protein